MLKLSVDDVAAMRAEFVEGRRGEYARLGRKYGVSSTQARNIILRLQR